jgi:DNA (cytosine-5)-methyltransferase 1
MKYNKEKPLKVFTTFSGYDSQCLALKKAHIPFELIGWSEIEKRAIDAHNVLFPEYKDKNYGDICKIDWENVPDFDFFTYSSPCQSFSIAGKKLGGEEGSGTKSSLLWECKKAIEIKRPKYLMLENVKNLVGNKFFPTFKKWLEFLDSLGYTSYWKVLNGADFGIPQARERVFVVSVLNPDGEFEWPRPIKQTKCMNDFLQKPSEIPPKCYVSQVCTDEYVKSNPNILKFAGETNDEEFVEREVTDSGKYAEVVKKGKQTDFVCQTVKDFDEEFEENIFGEKPDEVEVDMYNKILQIGNIRTDRATFPNPQSTRIYSPKGVAPTFTLVYAPLILVKENGQYKVRETTGVEEMRLIGVEFDDVQKLVDMGLDNTKLCKLAGNSIVVDVMSAFYKEMIKV